MAVLSNKRVKIRKDRVCFGCARKILTGNMMHRVATTADGSVATDYWCDVCQTYWQQHMNYDDEIGIGELKSEDPKGWERIRQSIEGADSHV